MATITSGGDGEIEAKAETVSPCTSSPTRRVTMVTPDGNWRRAARKSSPDTVGSGVATRTGSAATRIGSATANGWLVPLVCTLLFLAPLVLARATPFVARRPGARRGRGRTAGCGRSSGFKGGPSRARLARAGLFLCAPLLELALLQRARHPAHVARQTDLLQQPDHVPGGIDLVPAHALVRRPREG